MLFHEPRSLVASTASPPQGTGFLPALQETLKVTPGAIKLSRAGTVGAAPLATATFDATAVSPASIRMLVNGTVDAAPAQSGGAPARPRAEGWRRKE
jgi:hypothetical protein